MEVNKNLAYDIGAFTGDTVSMLNSLGYKQVVCFEPIEENFSHISVRPGVIAVKKAVSDFTGKMMMTVVPDRPYWNSLNPEWFSTSRHAITNSYQVEVETVTLNDYIESAGEIPAYIKIDAEGHEVSIIKGLSYKPDMISFEWVSEFYDKTEACLKMLSELGFTSFKIGITEKIPTAQDHSHDHVSCIQTLNDYYQNDKDKKFWGNIWCK